MEVKIIRSRRRSLSMQIHNGVLLIRAPYQATDALIQEFIGQHRRWIEKHSAPVETVDKLTQEELNDLADQALKVIPERVRYYAPLVGVSYGRITIRNQRTRWGSCSSKGNLNFNCLLILAPPEVIDSVVVHELCHRKQMNHSPLFYEEVLKVYPDYPKWNRWLKEHGQELMARMP